MATKVFDIAANIDDQYVVAGGVHRTYYTYASKTYISVQLATSSQYGVKALLRWNTSSIPDDATIDSALLRIFAIEKGNPNSRNVTASYYDWDGVGASDYNASPSTNAISGFPLSSIAVGGTTDIPLENVTNISKSGYTSLRLYLSGLSTDAWTYLNIADSYWGQPDDFGQVAPLPAPPAVQLIVTYTPANQPPVADFSVSGTALSRTFTDASTDADGTITSRAWNFGDGGTSASTSPSHTYTLPGTYTVTLTVTDNLGATGTISRSVTVTAAGTGRSYLSKAAYSHATTLALEADATQTELSVSDLSYWPQAGDGLLGLEKITWTGKSTFSGSGALTGVTRGTYGTTAIPHSAGTPLYCLGRHDGAISTKRKIPLMPSNASITLQELRRHSDSQKFVWADFNNFWEQAELNLLGAPTASGNISITLDEGGTPTVRTVAVTGTREAASLTINTAPTAAGDVDVNLNGVSRLISAPTVREQAQITITHGTTVPDVKFHVYVPNLGTGESGAGYGTAATLYSSEQVAQFIADHPPYGWSASRSGAVVTLTAITGGARANDVRFDPQSSGATATVTTLVQGGPGTAISLADAIRDTSFSGWTTAGTVGTTTVTFTALEAGPRVDATFSPRSTGCTGTMTTTTPGALDSTSQIATNIRTLYAANTYWTVGGTGAIVSFIAKSAGARQDATFSPGTTGVVGAMRTINQGSADVVAHIQDSAGNLWQRRILGNIATTTVFNLETAVSGAGTEKGIVTVWGSFSTDPKVHIWRVTNLDLSDHLLGETAYGVTSESTSGLTWDVYTDEVLPTNRGETYYRDHNSSGELLGQAYHYGILLPGQARQDLYIQNHRQPVLPGQQIALALFLRYENAPTEVPAQPLFITLYYSDGSVDELGDATNTLGLSGDGVWAEYAYPPFTIPDGCVEFRINSRDMSQGAFVIQELVYSIGTEGKRTRYYAFNGTVRTQLDLRTPKPTPYTSLGRKRTDLSTQYDGPPNTYVTTQYRASDDPNVFELAWSGDPAIVPDFGIIQAESALAGDGISTPRILSGFPRAEYRKLVEAKPIHVLLRSDRTELDGCVLMDNVEEWFPRYGVDPRILPSGHVRRQKLHEPVGYLPPFDLIALRPEAVKYISQRWGTEEFYAEIWGALLKLKLLSEPVFQANTMSAQDSDGRRSYWRSNKISAEVLEASAIDD